ncbi:MAG: NAD-dependent epimerase/dehydratase family protein, partial [Burkholderiales bacterium]
MLLPDPSTPSREIKRPLTKRLQCWRAPPVRRLSRRWQCRKVALPQSQGESAVEVASLPRVVRAPRAGARSLRWSCACLAREAVGRHAAARSVVDERHLDDAACDCHNRARLAVATTGPVIVTGGAGFIGSTLADALVARGREVHVVDNLATGHRKNLPVGATFHEVDIRDAAAVARVASESGAVAIFHMAAQADVRKAIDDPAFDADVNIGGTLSVLEAARINGARVLFAATGGGAYGEYDGLPIPTPETADPRPMSHYGQSKLSGEAYCALYGRLYGIPTVRLRLGNVYGPRQDPHGEAGVVAIFSGKLIDGEPMKVFGDGL